MKQCCMRLVTQEYIFIRYSNSKMDNLFGPLPDHPPSDDSFCSSCSECRKESRITRPPTANENQTASKLPTKTCQFRYEHSRSNPTNQIMKAISSARNLHHLKVPERYQYYTKSKTQQPSDQIVKRNNERLEYELRKQDIDEKYANKMREKSSKLGVENEQKRQVGVMKREGDLKEQRLQLQKGAFIALREQKVQYVKNLQRKIIHLEKERLISAKQSFKEELQSNEGLATRQLQSIESSNNNQLMQLKEQLEELKLIKRVNKVDQKKVLHSLEQELRKEQERANQKLVSEVQNQLQRAKLMGVAEGRKVGRR